MKQYFIEKKQELLEEKSRLEAVDYSSNVKNEVDEFKAQKEQEIKDFEIATVEKYDAIKKADVKKVDCYIEFVDKEFNKILEKEKEAETTVAENATVEVQPIV